MFRVGPGGNIVGPSGGLVGPASAQITFPPSFVFEVDWDNDGDFNEAIEDVTAYVVGDSTTARGRDYASQLLGRSTPGRLTWELRNPDGRFSRFNTSSPIYGSLFGGRLCRWRMTNPYNVTLWTGYVDDIVPSAGAIPMARLTAKGPLSRLKGKVSPAALNTVETGDVVTAILDEAGWPSALRQIAGGEVFINAWYVDGADPLAALFEIETTELGFLHETRDGYIAFANRYYNISGDALVSQVSLSDAPGASLTYLEDISESDPMREVFNDIQISVEVLTPQNLALLWTYSGDVITLAPGETRAIFADYPNDASDASRAAYVSSWATPVVGTDVTSIGGTLSVSAAKSANRMLISITNNHVTDAATITLLQAWGVAVYKSPATIVTGSDGTSQIDYSVRTFPADVKWLPNTAYAQALADYVMATKADPKPIINVRILAYDAVSLFHAVVHELGERITLTATDMYTRLGVSQEFHIENIAHRWNPSDRQFITTWELSPADPDPGYVILDQSNVESADVLAY